MEFFESESIELKREWSKEKCLKEVVSFLNTRDGTIYIGIDNNGSVFGVKNLEKTLNEIRENIKELILPSTEMLYELTSKFVEDKHIIVINIKKGNSLYYIKKYGKSSSGCFYRNGTSCESMSDSEIEKRIVSSLPRLSLSDIPINHSNLSFNTLKLLINSNGYSINEDNFLKTYNLLTIDNKYNLLSLLVSDQNQTPLIVSVFDGENKTDFIERRDFGNGSLLHATSKVIDYFDAINKRFIKIESKVRKEINSFDINAFREAWINACVHNKWELKLSPQVYKYSNRIEIISWGGIPNNISKEEFLSGLSKPVNPDLMQIFLKCDLCEHSGFGVPIIVEKYGVEAFSFFDDRIVVTIPINQHGFNNKENKTSKNNNIYSNISTNYKELTNRDELNDSNIDRENKDYKTILKLIKSNKTITKKEIANYINKSVRTVSRLISKNNEVKYVGNSRQGYWEIIE